MSFKSYVCTFLLGGIIVPTAAVALAVYYIFAYYSVPYTPEEAARKVSSFLATGGSDKPPGDTIDAKGNAVSPNVITTGRTPEALSYPAPKRHVRPLSGWMIVRRDFYGKDATDKSTEGTSSTNNSADAASGAATPISNAGATMSTAAARYSNLIKDSYLSFARGGNHPGSASATPTPGNDPSTSAVPNNNASSGMQEKVFAVLKGKVLFLYADDTKSDCLGALDIEAFSVGISRGDDSDEDGEMDDQENPQKYVMREGELFSKRNAIVLRSVPRLGDDDYEPVSHSRKRSRSDGLKRSTSAKSVRSSGTAMSTLTPSMGTATKKPTITRKSTQSCATDLKHMSDKDKAKVDGNEKLPPVMTALTKDMDNGTSGVPIPGQDQLADAAEARDKTMLEVEEEEKEKRRKEKATREKRRTRIEGRPWYLFLRNNVKMEEWYLSLLSISTPSVPSPGALDDLDERTKKALKKLTARPGVDEIFSKDNMKKLTEKLNTDPDQGNVRWLNGLVGRLFLGICNTVALEAFIIQRVMKKINKAKFPSWIEYIRIDEVDVGDVPPTFSKPMLKELTEDGAYAADVHLNYEGEFRLKVSAAGSFSIRGTNLGRATAQLNVRILSIQGNLRIKINKPPSNRIWWCFSEPPQIVMHVEPILASRRMQLNALTRVIEKQIRDGIAEACVMPFCDDIPFFDTSNLRPRGGIFDQFGKKRGQDGVPISTGMGAEGLEPKPLSDDGVNKKIDAPSRHRSTSLSAVAPSMAPEALDSPAQSTDQEERDKVEREWTAKTERAPADAASTSSLAKSLSSGTKKWFAGHASSGDTYGSGTTSPATKPETTHDESETVRESAQLDSAPAGLVVSSERTQSPALTPSLDDANKDLPTSREVRHDAETASSSGDLGGARNLPSEDLPSTEAAPGSLIETIRSRAKDKQALQTSVNQAKDAMRKWGTNWAAKRNLPVPALSRSPDDRGTGSGNMAETRQTVPVPSSAVSRNPNVRAMDIPRAGLSLQERLANVTQLATSPDRKPRHSSESEFTASGGHLSQSFHDDDAPLSRQTGTVSNKQALRNQAKNRAGTVAPKMPERPNATKETVSFPSQSTTPESAPPRLPPRASQVSVEGRIPRMPSEITPKSRVDTSMIPESPITIDTPHVAPPPLPSRASLQETASGSNEVAASESNVTAESAIPSPSLSKAEEVLKGVMASQ